MERYIEIYPQLPSDVNPSDNNIVGDTFRLKQATEWLSQLEKDLQEREKIYKKYNRTRGVLFNVSAGSGTLSVAFSGGGLGTGLTGVGIPVAVGLGIVGGVCALTSLITASLSKVISKKVSKHEKIVSVCQAKINTIKHIVSKSLVDNKISHEEFFLVKTEFENYHEMKRSIREKYRKQQKPPQEVDLKKIEEEIRAEMLKKLTLPETSK